MKRRDTKTPWFTAVRLDGSVHLRRRGRDAPDSDNPWADHGEAFVMPPDAALALADALREAATSSGAPFSEGGDDGALAVESHEPKARAAEAAFAKLRAGAALVIERSDGGVRLAASVGPYCTSCGGRR